MTAANLKSLNGMRVAVTGAGGFVGSHLTQALVNNGAEVTALCRGEAPRLREIEASIEVRRLDLCDPESMRAALSTTPFDFLFHVAAYGVQSRDRDATMAAAVNVRGTVQLIEAAAAARVARFVQVGTSHEYGAGACLAEDAPLAPVGIYGATKAVAMLLGRDRAAELGLDWTGIRPFVAYGPGEDSDKLIPYVVRRALAGEKVVTTSGEMVRDFIYVGDLVEGMQVAALTELPTGAVLNLATGVGSTLATVIKTLAELIPGTELDLGGRESRPDDVAEQIADTHLSQLLLQWSPGHSLREGLALTVEGIKDSVAGR